MGQRLGLSSCFFNLILASSIGNQSSNSSNSTSRPWKLRAGGDWESARRSPDISPLPVPLVSAAKMAKGLFEHELG